MACHEVLSTTFASIVCLCHKRKSNTLVSLMDQYCNRVCPPRSQGLCVDKQKVLALLITPTGSAAVDKKLYFHTLSFLPPGLWTTGRWRSPFRTGRKPCLLSRTSTGRMCVSSACMCRSTAQTALSPIRGEFTSLTWTACTSFSLATYGRASTTRSS